MAKKIPLEFYRDKTNLKIIGEEGRYLIVENKYGQMKIFKPHLLKGVVPSIRTAINPQEYCINQFIEVHGGRYDYSLVVYVNDRSKVKIICSEHGVFEQEVNGHKHGSGCKKCGDKIGGTGDGIYTFKTAIKNKEDWCDKESGVYILQLTGGGEEFLKIGISKDINRRVKDIRRDSNYNVELISYEKMELYTAVMIENELLNDKCNIKYKPKNRFAGETECILKYPYSKYLQKDFLKRVRENGH